MNIMGMSTMTTLRPMQNMLGSKSRVIVMVYLVITAKDNNMTTRTQTPDHTPQTTTWEGLA